MIDSVAELRLKVEDFRVKFTLAKQQIGGHIPWYPYDSLSSLDVTAMLLYQDVVAMSSGRRILDLACADGGNSFFLASLGFGVDAIDYEATNYNRMRGVRALADHFRSDVAVHSVDLDSQFRLPRQDYGLALFLGILYHLKNPFFALEQLARSAKHCFLSTRIAKFDPSKTHSIETIPVGYLVSPTQTNNDSTNFWIFSKAGLMRLFERTGWEVCAFQHFGNVTDSDPASSAGDERAFCVLKSRMI
jgi:2-polyprenyl-3-methyl-5-hydroxy-6-metoxy-1,4-benzoquinol methylase